MFCGECGTETSDQASFCPACGHDLRWQRAQRTQRQQSTRSDETVSSVSGAPRAGFWRRFAAHAIDVFVVWLAIEIVWGSLGEAMFGFWYWVFQPIEGAGALAAYFFFTPVVSQLFESFQFMGSVTDYATAYEHGQVSRAPWLWVSMALIPLAAILAYYVIGTAKWGRTLGKAALGIRVVGPDGAPPGIVRTIIRETLGKFLSLIFWIGFLMAAGRQKRGLHDRLAVTEVDVTGWNWLKRENLTQEDAR